MVNIQASPGLTLPRKPWSLLAIILRLSGIPWLRMLKSLRVLVHTSLELDTLYANSDSMRHRVLFAFPKPKAFMALGADGIDEGTEATQARVIHRYRRVTWKRWRLSLTKIDITWTKTLILKINTRYQFWSTDLRTESNCAALMIKDTIMWSGPRRKRGRTRWFTSSTFWRQRLH